MSGVWQHGLCGCFDNCGICIVAYFIPCYTFGKNAELMGKSCCVYGIIFLVPVVNFIMGMLMRGEIRQHRGIGGSILNDLLAWWCCPMCALIQEGQELQSPTGSYSTQTTTTTVTVMQRS